VVNWVGFAPDSNGRAQRTEEKGTAMPRVSIGETSATAHLATALAALGLNANTFFAHGADGDRASGRMSP
jgi:hypothetical protein